MYVSNYIYLFTDDDINDNTTYNEINTTIDVNEKRTLRKRQTKSTIAIKKNAKGETQLHQACINGNINLVRRLIEQGHAINVRDNAGWLPLHEACNYGHKEIVELLLDRNAAINDKGGERCDGTTPLHDACGNGNLEIIELLIERGANVTLLMDSGETPLDVLKKWRTIAGNLSKCDEIFYDTMCQKLSDKLKVAGVCSNVTAAMPRTTISSVENSPEKSLTKRSSRLSLRNSLDNDDMTQCSKDTRKQSAIKNYKRISNDYDNEQIDTIESIIEKKFPDQNFSNQLTQFNPVVEDDADDDDTNDSIDLSYRRPIEHLNSTTNYKEIMNNLRYRRGGAVPSTSALSPQKPSSSSSFVQVNKVTKRSAFLNSSEIDDDWLDDDIGQVNKKQKFLSDRLYTKKPVSSLSLNKSKHTTPTKRTTTLSSAPSTPSPKKTKTSTVVVVPDTDDDYANYNINDFSDDNSTDAFNILMTNRQKSDGNNKKQRRSRNSSESSVNSSMRQQSSLLDAGFCKFKSNDEQIDNQPDSTYNFSVTKTPVKLQTNYTPTTQISSTNTMTAFHSVKVKIEELTVNIPVNKDVINDVTIGWLADEASRRYYKYIFIILIIFLIAHHQRDNQFFIFSV